jgi:hypothetical protein
VFSSIIVPTGCAFFDAALSKGAVKPSAPGGQLVFGDFHGDLHSVLLQPPELHDVQRVTTEASFDQGITDVQVGPDGDLYVSTATSIVRIAAGTGIPFTPAGPKTPTPSASGGTGATDGGGGLGTGSIVLIVAAVILIADGVFVLISRARKRRAGTPPPS